MGIVSFVVMVLGWLLIIVAAFGSGLNMHIGTLSGVDAGVVLVLAALCLGVGPGLVGPYWPRRAP